MLYGCLSVKVRVGSREGFIVPKRHPFNNFNKNLKLFSIFYCMLFYNVL